MKLNACSFFRCNIKFFVGFSGVGFSSGCGFHRFLVKIDYYEDVDGNQVNRMFGACVSAFTVTNCIICIQFIQMNHLLMTPLAFISFSHSHCSWSSIGQLKSQLIFAFFIGNTILITKIPSIKLFFHSIFNQFKLFVFRPKFQIAYEWVNSKLITNKCQKYIK